MHTQSQASNLSDDALLGGTAILRGSQPEDRGLRFGPNDDTRGLRQGKEGTLGTALTEALDRAENLLDEVQADRTALPGQDARQTLRRHVDSESDESCGQQGGHQEARVSACSQTQLRDWTSRGGSGLVDDQQVAGARELCNHHDLSALSPRAPEQYAQSTGLAPRQATADIDAAKREQLGAEQQRQQPAASPTIADILSWGAAQMVTPDTRHRVRDTLAKISLCRTHVMGGRKFQCEDCDEVSTRYNSCGDRHCPRCSGAKRSDFNDKASKLIVDGVVYYQVVMTLPSILSELALSNRELFSDLLPKAAWSTVDRAVRSEQGYQGAAISVLHTWNQRLDSHWHVHLLVPGEGPSLSGDQWKKATPPPESSNDTGFYLVDTERLKDNFRRGFLLRLQHARQRGKLRLSGRHAHLLSDENWQAMIAELESQTWVAFIQPPPTRESVAKHVVKYLTRYLTGGPISDHRIVRADAKEVTFLAREGKRVGGEREQVPVTLSTEEFTQRWCQHIQPEQLTKVRYFGGWSNPKVTHYARQCDELSAAMQAETPFEPASQIDSQAIAASAPDMICEHCGSERMVAVSSTNKPSWRELLGYGAAAAPTWYTQVRNEADRRFWDALMGEGYNDWYLETLEESAKEAEAQTIASLPAAPPTQLPLPGFDSSGSYLLNTSAGYLLDSF